MANSLVKTLVFFPGVNIRQYLDLLDLKSVFNQRAIKTTNTLEQLLMQFVTKLVEMI